MLEDGDQRSGFLDVMLTGMVDVMADLGNFGHIGLLNINITPFGFIDYLFDDADEKYVMEYTPYELAYLRLRPKTRARLNVSVTFVVLGLIFNSFSLHGKNNFFHSDPVHDRCFGSSSSVFLLDEVIGYGEVLLSSIKQVASIDGIQGMLID